MKKLIAKIENALLKPVTKDSGVTIATVVVIGLTALVVSIYMGWIKFKKNAW